jgi:lysophospholipase L1-like esterase
MVVLATLLRLLGCHLVDRNGDGTIEIVCLGDSNTGMAKGWCEAMVPRLASATRLATPDCLKVINRGMGGMTAFDEGENSPFTSVPLDAGWHLDRIFTTLAPDVLILSLGTNDIVSGGRTPAETSETILALRERARARGIDVLVASVPPVYGKDSQALDPKIRSLNELLKRAIPSREYIDFYSDMPESIYVDSMHVNASGQAERAERASRQLAR